MVIVTASAHSHAEAVTTSCHAEGCLSIKLLEVSVIVIYCSAQHECFLFGPAGGALPPRAARSSGQGRIAQVVKAYKPRSALSEREGFRCNVDPPAAQDPRQQHMSSISEE